jgi:hypothetical protein
LIVRLYVVVGLHITVRLGVISVGHDGISVIVLVVSVSIGHNGISIVVLVVHGVVTHTSVDLIGLVVLVVHGVVTHTSVDLIGLVVHDVVTHTSVDLVGLVIHCVITHTGVDLVGLVVHRLIGLVVDLVGFLVVGTHGGYGSHRFIEISWFGKGSLSTRERNGRPFILIVSRTLITSLEYVTILLTVECIRFDVVGSIVFRTTE